MMSLFFCGHLGKTELGAVALANTLSNVIVFGAINGIATACDTLLPQVNTIRIFKQHHES
jgi:Na+-driven multidrug efflux pump